MRSEWHLAIGLFIAALVGCEGVAPAPIPTTTSSTTTAPAKPEYPATAAALKPADLKVVTGDEKKLTEMIAAHKGEVVFVDYWATWCGPCVEYFPHTVELHKANRDKGLRTISVSFDALADEPAVREFLAEHNADFEHLLSSYDGAGSEAFDKFVLEQVPTFRLYDRKGVKRYEWEEKPKDAEEKIAELLAEQG